MDTAIAEALVTAINTLGAEVNNHAHKNGFWDHQFLSDGVHPTRISNPSIDAEKLCLVHTEISEAVEALRAGDPPDDKIPEFSGMEAELADAIIRIVEFAQEKNLRLGEAIVAKHAYNLTRPYKHGKKF